MLVKRIIANQTGSYFIKAIALTACLTLLGTSAPYLPSVLIPFILIIYSAIATIGGLYHTVIRRVHKQYKLSKAGKLSQINRKWVLKLVGFFIMFLVSGFLFVLKSPKWDLLEWMLIWLTVPVYFGVFTITQRRLSKEYAPKFCKAHAMRWSFWIVGAFLCLAYAIIAVLFQTNEPSSLSEALQNTSRPFENAPSALLCEVDKLSSFVDGLTSYVVAEVSRFSFITASICQFIIYASVFFGLVNQFSFCLLNNQEIRSEFQLLPADENIETASSILKRYIVIVAALSILTVATFLGVEFEVAKAQATKEHTVVDGFIADQRERISFVLDGGYEKSIEQSKRRNEYIQSRNELLNKRDEELLPVVNRYYDQCLDNIDSYLDWYDSPVGGFAKLVKPFGNFMGDMAKNTFIEKITNEADSSPIEERYREYQDQLNELEEGYYINLTGDELNISRNEVNLDLWMPLATLEDNSIIGDLLLNTEDNVDRESLKVKISELIETARADTLAVLEADHSDGSAA